MAFSRRTFSTDKNETFTEKANRIERQYEEGDSSFCVVGYRTGPKNPYLEKLMQM